MIFQGFTRSYHGLIFYSCSSPFGSSRAGAAESGVWVLAKSFVINQTEVILKAPREETHM